MKPTKSKPTSFRITSGNASNTSGAGDSFDDLSDVAKDLILENFNSTLFSPSGNRAISFGYGLFKVPLDRLFWFLNSRDGRCTKICAIVADLRERITKLLRENDRLEKQVQEMLSGTAKEKLQDAINAEAEDNSDIFSDPHALDEDRILRSNLASGRAARGGGGGGGGGLGSIITTMVELYRQDIVAGLNEQIRKNQNLINMYEKDIDILEKLFDCDC